MRKPKILALFVVMSVAVIGVVILQFIYFRNIYQQQRLGFNQSIHIVLDEVRTKIEQQDFINSFKTKEDITQKLEHQKTIVARAKRHQKKPSLEQVTHRFKSMQQNFYKHMFPDLKHQKTPEKQETEEQKRYQDSIYFLKTQVRLLEQLTRNLTRANIPLILRIKKDFLEQTLQTELEQQGLFLPYRYELTSNNTHKILLNKGQINESISQRYSVKIFAQNNNNESGILTLIIEGGDNYLIGKMSTLIGFSIFLLLIMLIGVGYTINTVIQQKKIADMKTEFINNMTHEFKTPISTIMIASEALQEPRVMENPQKVAKMGKIIHSENLRLSTHIERVLGIAKLELKEFELKRNHLDMHQIITHVTDNMRLQVEKNSGNIYLELNAQNSNIVGDELHVANIVLNLIDNAIKYSASSPAIWIRTFNDKKYFNITIQDNGIGIPKAQLSKIFNQFYRVPTGNVHNVKGFGLGLSYVQTIINKMNGSITVTSEKDKGTVFTLKFLLA